MNAKYYSVRDNRGRWTVCLLEIREGKKITGNNIRGPYAGFLAAQAENAKLDGEDDCLGDELCSLS